MNIRKIFLLLVLVLFLAGITYASNITDDTNSGEIQKIEKTSSSIIKENNINTKTKNIKKQNTTNKNIKTSSKSYDINNYNELKNALTSKNYDNITINIKSNIILTNNTTVNQAIKTLKINGNNKTIDGNQKYQFLKIENDKININHLNIKNCKAEEHGAILNYGEMTVTNCNFINNKATGVYSSGAIYNIYGTLTVANCNFTNNTANSGGGAIHNEDGNLKVTNCNFTNNKAERGGAINNYAGTLTVANCNFTKNKAELGGAIHNTDSYNLKVTHCNLTNNTADAGSAICSVEFGFSEYIIISNNNFNNNIAKTKGSAIIVEGENNIISNNAGASTSACSSTIVINGTNTIIANNTFKGKQINNTKLTLNYKGSMIYSEKINITGQLTSNKTALPGCSIKITINNQQTTTIKTDNKGYYQYTFKTNKIGTNKITATYNGNNNYTKSTATKTFQIKKIPTKITIIKITQKNQKDNLKIMGKFTSQNGKALINTQLKLKINNKTITTKTNNNGIFTYTFKGNKNTLNKVKISYETNSKYGYAKTSTTKTFNQTTKLALEKIPNKKINNKITIKGTFKSITGKKLINTKLKININNKKTITIKTNNKGQFKYSFKATKTGTNKITVTYNENSKYAYAPNSNTKYFKVNN